MNPLELKLSKLQQNEVQQPREHFCDILYAKQTTMLTTAIILTLEVSPTIISIASNLPVTYKK